MAEGAWLGPVPLGIAEKPAAKTLRDHVDDVRFLVFGRSLPAVLFGVMGYRVLLILIGQTHDAFAHASAAAVLGVVPTALYLVFCAIPVGVYLTRSRPRARDGRIAARAAALIGTTMLLFVGILGGPALFTSPAALQVAATLLSVIAFAVGVCGLLALRRNLSLMPEARRLVTSGPYRFVRHPLYAAEILAAAAMVLAHPALWAAVSLAPFVAVQLTRATFEERLLRDTFNDYAANAQRTRRLLPAIW
ncbi:MAG: isoprenylcysteine carboxylmethyltransferase family protein [Candidatus Dormibacteraeota bacterium]|nr:isoprenylcysteine carboxylmethyltransferase family protein [Candidatus Dormibacteraeota bacterium]